jgi:putative nucleotidyltransferase with HDIG domain
VTQLLALSEALARKDADTAVHAQQVAVLAERVGVRLGMAASDLRSLRWGALLHDVGKVEISDHLLAKQSALTSSEYDQVKQHTVIGARMVERVARLGKVHQLVRWSHERWDGTGYPDGLAGTAIPLGSRVIFVCDAFDAMVSDRPYRSAMPVEEALAELRTGAGAQFDPDVVDALVAELAGASAADARIA